MTLSPAVVIADGGAVDLLVFVVVLLVIVLIVLKIIERF